MQYINSNYQWCGLIISFLTQFLCKIVTFMKKICHCNWFISSWIHSYTYIAHIQLKLEMNNIHWQQYSSNIPLWILKAELSASPGRVSRSLQWEIGVILVTLIDSQFYGVKMRSYRIFHRSPYVASEQITPLETACNCNVEMSQLHMEFNYSLKIIVQVIIVQLRLRVGSQIQINSDFK